MTQYTKPTVLPAWGESAGGADVLQPSNAEIQAGWPLTNVPPSRKRFNWILKYLAQGVRYLMQMGIPLWDAAEDYPVNARVMGSNGKTYRALQTSINQDPTTATAYWALWGVDGRDGQLQLTTAFTTAGTAPNFTLTPVPAPAALAANLRFRVKFHAAGAGSDVINIAGFGNKSVKQYDSTGAKVAATITLGQLCDIEYDGTDLVILDPLPSSVVKGSQVFTSSGTFTVPANVTEVVVEVWGGGGGGGGPHTASGGGAGGGGAGGYAMKRITGLTPGATIAVTVGTGGSSQSTVDTAGFNGNSSSFGAYCSATGGTGGTPYGGPGTDVAGGTGTGGDINLTGGGGNSDNLTNKGTFGGNAPRGGAGGVGGWGSISGGAGTVPGGGGGGADNGGSAGGAGGAGMVYVRWGF